MGFVNNIATFITTFLTGMQILITALMALAIFFAGWQWLFGDIRAFRTQILAAIGGGAVMLLAVTIAQQVSAALPRG